MTCYEADHLSALEVGQGDLVLADVGLREVPQLDICGQHPSEIPKLDHSNLLCRNLAIVEESTGVNFLLTLCSFSSPLSCLSIMSV